MALVTTSPGLASALLVILATKFLLWRQRVKKLPPGPPKLPLIGNLFNIPAGLDWVGWADIGRRYNSDVIHLGALGFSIVVLNSYQAAQDLLDQRSAIYSSRPVTEMTHKVIRMDNLFGVMPYGDTWREHRRLFTKHFGVGNRPRDVFYVRRFLAQLLANSEDVLDRISCLISAINISMTYGLRPIGLGNNDHYTLLSKAAVDGMVHVETKGPWMVDLIPALQYLPRWLPGMNFLDVAASISRNIDAARNGLYEAGTSTLNSRDHCPSFLSEAFQDLEDLPEAEVEGQKTLIKEVAYMGFGAASDTNRSALGTFFLAMTCYPEVQLKARQELDQALTGRLPEHNDVESLPYLTAVVMEVLRWKPIVLGVPHVVILDDVYRGYNIPKDSLVFPNQRAILQDPSVYPDPSEFRPERFLKAGQIDESVMNPVNIAFGFGRRQCPGRHIALALIKLTVASVLLTFEIQKQLDKDGKPIEPKQEYSFGVICQPMDFPYVIKPRSQAAKDAIDAWAMSEGDNPP